MPIHHVGKGNSIIHDRQAIDDVFKLDLRVGTVKGAVPVPKSKKLLQLQVDIGDEIATAQQSMQADAANAANRIISDMS